MEYSHFQAIQWWTWRVWTIWGLDLNVLLKVLQSTSLKVTMILTLRTNYVNWKWIKSLLYRTKTTTKLKSYANKLSDLRVLAFSFNPWMPQNNWLSSPRTLTRPKLSKLKWKESDKPPFSERLRKDQKPINPYPHWLTQTDLIVKTTRVDLVQTLMILKSVRSRILPSEVAQFQTPHLLTTVW